MFDKQLKEIGLPRSIFIAVALSKIITAACLIIGALFLGYTIQQLWQQAPFVSLIREFCIIVISFVIIRLCSLAESIMMDRCSNRVTKALHDEILAITFFAPPFVSPQKSAQELTSLAVHKIDEINNYIRIILPKMLGLPLVSLPLCIAVGILDYVSAIIILATAVAIIFFMILLGKQAKRHSERQYASFTRLTNRFIDTLRGMSTIKAHHSEDAEEKRTYRASEALRKATIKTLRVATLSSTVMDLLIVFAVAGASIMLAFRLIDGTVTLSLALSLLILIPECFAPLRQFASDYHASLDGKNALADLITWRNASYKNLKKYDMSPEDLINNQNTVDDSQSNQVSFPKNITFQNITYRYDDTSPQCIIDTLSFSFPLPSKIALIGKSGSGKTTLAHLFAGFMRPSSGSIRIDDKPLLLDQPEWKDYVRYIPQHPYLFRMSIKDNVAFYKPDASAEEINNALEKVGLRSFVHTLDKGIDTLLGEGNLQMSGGQAHRIALARILLDDKARILIFDEPTAHLDIETEYAIKPFMLEVMKNKCVIFATHRLHWLKDMDYCIHLDTNQVEKLKNVRGETDE